MRQWLLATGHIGRTFTVICDKNGDQYHLYRLNDRYWDTFSSIDECAHFLEYHNGWTINEIVEV